MTASALHASIDTGAPPHLVIMASAGSGKTHRLTDRYLTLLANGVDPGRILATTFTRLAAGEIRMVAKAAGFRNSEPVSVELEAGEESVVVIKLVAQDTRKSD